MLRPFSFKGSDQIILCRGVFDAFRLGIKKITCDLIGFVHSEDKTVLRIRDLATGKIDPVQTANIKQRTQGGTVMPPGLTVSLTRTELGDFISYLFTLKTTSQPK